jgi:hypothetical protein
MSSKLPQSPADAIGLRLYENGFEAENISGGMLARSVLMKAEMVPGSLD